MRLWTGDAWQEVPWEPVAGAPSIGVNDLFAYYVDPTQEPAMLLWRELDSTQWNTVALPSEVTGTSSQWTFEASAWHDPIIVGTSPDDPQQPANLLTHDRESWKWTQPATGQLVSVDAGHISFVESGSVTIIDRRH